MVIKVGENFFAVAEGKFVNPFHDEANRERAVVKYGFIAFSLFFSVDGFYIKRFTLLVYDLECLQIQRGGKS